MSDATENSGLPEGFEIDEKQQIYWSYLVAGLVDSSIWQMGTKDDKILWITCLALKDKNGNIFNTLPGLAKDAHLTIRETETALRHLMSPDKYSKTKLMEGRRLVEIEGGWRVVTHKIFRDLIQKQVRKAQKAKWERDNYEAKKKQNNLDINLDISGHTLDIPSSIPRPLLYTNTKGTF